MKIGPLDTKPGAVGAAGERGQGSPRAAAVSRGDEASAKVELSAAATSALAAAGPAFDAAKVQRIAQAIRDGRYEIDAGAIADKLLANARELLARAQH